jgi:hypothetical protein
MAQKGNFPRWVEEELAANSRSLVRSSRAQLQASKAKIDKAWGIIDRARNRLQASKLKQELRRRGQ